MRKAFILFCIVLIIFFTIVSRHDTSNLSIENLAYVIAIGIDNGEKNILKLTLQIATSSNGSPSESSSTSQSDNSTITSVECNSIESGLNLINSYISKQLNLSHCKIIVFSEEFAVNGISDEISTLVNNVEIRPNCSIAICKSSAEDFLSINKPVLVNLTARFYDVVVNSGNYTGYSKNITLTDFYNAINDMCIEPVAILAGINFPYTRKTPSYTNYIDLDSSYTADELDITNNNNTQICGLAVFNDGYLVGEMTAMDCLCYLILSGELQNSIVDIPDPYNINKTINLSITQVKKPEIKVKIINGSPYIDCKLNILANILSLTENSDYTSTEKLNTIIQYANSYLKSHITNFLYKTTSNYKSDIVGFGKYAIRKFNTIREWKNYNWQDNYKNSFFSVHVDTNITNSSLIQKN